MTRKARVHLRAGYLLLLCLSLRAFGRSWTAPQAGTPQESVQRAVVRRTGSHTVQVSRRQTLTGAGVASAILVSEAAFAERLDEYGRAVLPDGRLTKTESLQICNQVSCFNDKPKVFVAGSTGELGRRAVLDMLRTGMSIYCGVRDEGRMYEVQYKNRTSSRYEMTVIQDALIEGGREQVLEEQLCDASVVVDVAGARFGLDILRPGSGLDKEEPEKCDLQGTKALVDAAKAKGVKKFIYVSAVLVNAKNLGEEVSQSDAYKNWNSFGDVLDKKLEAEDYIRKSGLDYTIIRPVPMTNEFPKDVGGIYFAKPDSLLLQDGDVGKKISRDDVGLAVVDAIFNPKASRGTFELTGVPKAPPTPREEWWELKSGKA